MAGRRWKPNKKGDGSRTARKEFAKFSDGRPPVALGKVPVATEAELSPQQKEIKRLLSPAEYGFLARARETGSFTEAYAETHPRASRASCAQRGSNLYRTILEKLEPVGGQDAVWTLLGLGDDRLANVLSEGMRACFQREFIDRNGKIVAGPERVDHPVRLNAASMTMKLRGLAKGEGPGVGAIQINIVSYLGPGPTTVWPGGGRPEWDRDGLPPGLVRADAPKPLPGGARIVDVATRDD